MLTFLEAFFFRALLVIAQRKNLLDVYFAQLSRLLPAATKG